MITQFSHLVLDTYHRCRQREMLPVAGGMLDQPLLLMHLFGLLDAWYFKRKQLLGETA